MEPTVAWIVNLTERAHMANQLVLKTCDLQLTHSILRCAVKYKGLDVIYHHLREGPPQFIDDGNTVAGFHNIIAHLEDRFPAPPLLVGDPMARSRQRMVFWQLTEALEHHGVVQALRDFIPFIEIAVRDGTYITGDAPTIIDVAVAAVCANEPAPFQDFRAIMEGFCQAQSEVA